MFEMFHNTSRRGPPLRPGKVLSIHESARAELPVPNFRPCWTCSLACLVAAGHGGPFLFRSSPIKLNQTEKAKNKNGGETTGVQTREFEHLDVQTISALNRTDLMMIGAEGTVLCDKYSISLSSIISIGDRLTSGQAGELLGKARLVLKKCPV